MAFSLLAWSRPCDGCKIEHGLEYEDFQASIRGCSVRACLGLLSHAAPAVIQQHNHIGSHSPREMFLRHRRSQRLGQPSLDWRPARNTNCVFPILGRMMSSSKPPESSSWSVEEQEALVMQPRFLTPVKFVHLLPLQALNSFRVLR